MAQPAVENPLDEHNSIRNQDEDLDEAEMERMMALQEEHDRHADAEDGDDFREDLDNDGGDMEDEEDHRHAHTHMPTGSIIKLHYSSISFLVTLVHVIYVLRTRKQVYLALLYLTSSKLSYIVLGNAVLAAFINSFHYTVRFFLNGLRLMETETIVDHIRWNVTETCIALTMFRQEISIKTIGIFLVLILGKCLHWAVELRINHLRMTEEVFYFLDDGDDLMFGVNDTAPSPQPIWWFWRAIGIFMPKSIKAAAYDFHQATPRIRPNHMKLTVLLFILYVIDVLSLTYCASHLLEEGPSIFIMFLFESAILIVSIMSSATLYNMHVFDGIINVLQRLVIDNHDSPQGPDHPDGLQETHNQNNEEDRPNRGGASRLGGLIVQSIASLWRDQRITAAFMVELMALAAKFLFHLTLFVAIFTVYGLPINIIRDFYLAFNKLKQRLIAFSSYRRLTCNMNTRFESVTTEEQIEKAGGTCIICRDKMEIHGIHGDCKILPICNHVFHKHCLREWLVQQQSCPICRGDIQTNEARAKALAQTEEAKEDDLEPSDGGRSTPSPQAIPEDFTGEPKTSSNMEILPLYQSIVDVTRPALFKVIDNSGTDVFELNGSADQVLNVSEVRSSIRTLKHGTIVVCTASQTCSYIDSDTDLSSEETSAETYLKVPDGWIKASAVEKLCQLQPREDSRRR